jgi:trehalose 6-phosphate phosphatase
MKDILAEERVLARLAASNTLIALDFDGTLAPIVVQRERAGMRWRTAELFEQLCSLYPCAVISGRARDDVGPRLGPAPVKYVMGNHGAEPGARLDEIERDIALARERLEPLLATWPDVELEDKRYSLSLHYRRSLHKEATLAAIVGAVACLPPFMRVVPGKLIVNIVSERARHKGQALLALRAAEQAELALYIGDDITDEDVFLLDQPERLVGVRVGESRASAAGHYLENQASVDVLLSRLITLRTSA